MARRASPGTLRSTPDSGAPRKQKDTAGGAASGGRKNRKDRAGSRSEPGLRAATDWQLAAALIAAGGSLRYVARRVGCSRDALSHRLHHDQEFQGWVEEARANPAWIRRRRVLRLRDDALAHIEKAVAGNNLRVVLWIADRLKLVTPVEERTPDEELRELLNSLTPEELEEFESLAEAEPAGPRAA